MYDFTYCVSNSPDLGFFQDVKKIDDLVSETKSCTVEAISALYIGNVLLNGKNKLCCKRSSAVTDNFRTSIGIKLKL
ncbi:MAG TPA: hypothetical protein DEQ32_17615 [Gammaproteobacteria bacterium]|nr:hypothetical protein [Gammaproteobacteria bacterium]